MIAYAVTFLIMGGVKMERLIIEVLGIALALVVGYVAGWKKLFFKNYFKKDKADK